MSRFDLDDLRRRARGSLLGAAVGDAMGSPVEGMSAAAIHERHGVITDFLSDTAVGTDDTDFTLFNAYILLTHGREVTAEQVEYEWRDKLLSGRDFYRPGGFSDVISTRNLEKGLHAPYSGAFNHQMWSDGVAMAIGSAGVVSAGNPLEAARIAAVLGCVSNARDGIYAAQAIAAAISVGMVGASPAEMFDAGVSVTPRDSWTRRALERARRAVEGVTSIDEALRRVEEAVVIHYFPWADLVTEAVPVAMAIFLAAKGDFVLGVPSGVRIGRDADTIGAMVGSLAGAYGGETAIPEAWRARVGVSTGKCIGFVANRSIVDIADGLANMAAQQSPEGETR